MRAQFLITLSLGLLAALPAFVPPALAQPAAGPARRPAPAPAAGTANAPQTIGTFEDWTAARYQEDGKTVCYALSRASKSAPPVPGRGEVWLTVTQRPAPATRDSVALNAGFAYPAGADVTVTVDLTALAFFTSQRFAFAKEGPAAVAVLQRGRLATARGPSPRNLPVEDTFSLRGFTQAYAAIAKACPPSR